MIKNQLLNGLWNNFEGHHKFDLTCNHYNNNNIKAFLRSKLDMLDMKPNKNIKKPKQGEIKNTSKLRF
jgi:hypothetical protein